ncbi:hypothetical protein ER596_09585 [Salmonella enterica subsp. enterica serovar Havana]|nr:hypothetical protein [Salmonella enterica]EBH9576124.1 hypothetical protein [Salmonella enterica subsp. enterica serovar Havana]EBV6448331.1 hypothetical protein [Salmonella enterica subsp. enterica serovar Ohio]EBW5300073.1 hypothetical protein [Salmonella enterica subsp. enterica serovar Bere]ECF7119426.1 hypothetical protein [Salmonella enterica subsp. enterica]EDV3997818.1 hypothetical protein [Salmonella enterica subsp. enterica serovar Mbandaka]KTJ29085.1 hypothetical protein ASU86_0
MLCLTAGIEVCVSTTCDSLRKGNRQAVKYILSAVATGTNGKKDVNALIFDRRDMRTDGIIARAVDIPAAVAMQINERFQSPDNCVSRLLKLSKEMFRENRRRDDRHCVSP